MKPYRIAILGAGTVGSRVLELLVENRQACEERAGRPLEIVSVAVQDPDRPRPFPAGLDVPVTGDTEGVCAGDGVDLVVELIGGIDAPRTWIRTALETGKDVVTANKAVLATHGDELFALARETERLLLFEASVAGAVPILQALQAGLPAGPIDRLTGILNGTCNSILSTMERGSDFATALREAQERGLAEADPTLDITGADAAHKLALLTRILTGRKVSLDGVRCEGIEAITPADLEYGKRFGWCLKLIARYVRHDDEGALGVYPAWISAGSALGAIGDEYNAIVLEGRPFDTLLFQGKGAGGPPTAGSVVADILRAARGEGSLPHGNGPLAVRDPFDTPAAYYVRFRVPDRPGVLARIAGAFGDHEISIAAVEQPPSRGDGPVPIHLITHPVEIGALDQALAALTGPPFESPLRVRIEADPEPGNEEIPS